MRKNVVVFNGQALEIEIGLIGIWRNKQKVTNTNNNKKGYNINFKKCKH